jgi:hypothetical protein
MNGAIRFCPIPTRVVIVVAAVVAAVAVAVGAVLVVGLLGLVREWVTCQRRARHWITTIPNRFQCWLNGLVDGLHQQCKARGWGARVGVTTSSGTSGFGSSWWAAQLPAQAEAAAHFGLDQEIVIHFVSNND